MCGIAGIYNYSSFAAVSKRTLLMMTRVMAHRGPDADGVYVDGALGLGHRRLSILDLSERGRQPMQTPDGRYVISYNGEVYNYLELRHELAARGHKFRTDTDTEVILHLFLEHGLDCLEKLNGMFAFAIWDSQERKLFLVRDRMGIKPLYYTFTSDGLLFGSEVKALLASGLVSAEVNAPRIDSFFTFGYVPGEDTLFKGISKLLPGNWLSVGTNGIRKECYWDIHFCPDNTRNVDQTALELRGLLQDAVKLRLRSDVPVGVFLSGGLDSSATVALLADAGVSDIQTFAVAYKHGSEYDETGYARLVADRFQTDHHVLYIEPDDFVDFIPGFVWHMDEPVAEAAAISLYFVAKLLRQQVTVALSGEGADELFGGYDIYRYMQMLERYRSLPAALRTGMLDPLLQHFGSAKIHKYLRLSRVPLEQRYVGVSLHETWYKDLLYSHMYRETLAANGVDTPLADLYAHTDGVDTLSRMQYVDLKSWLVDDLLIKADKMTMANSVELRVPFLDHRIVEYAATIPPAMKMKGRQVKWILKRAVGDLLPSEILRRKKVGFPTPLARMFGNDFSDYLKDLLLSERCLNRDYFRREAIARLIDEHMRKEADHHKILWQLIVLEEWHRAFIEETNFEARTAPQRGCPITR